MTPRIAVVTPWDLEDPTAWSGMVRPMRLALEAVTETVPVPTTGVSDAWQDRLAMRLLDGRGGRRLVVGHMAATGRKRGRLLDARLKAEGVDAVVAIAASQDLAFLPEGLPVVYVTDATFRAVVDFYPLYSALHPLVRRQGDLLERRALDRATHVAVASDWARDSVLRDYGVEPSRVSVVPFGPRCLADPASAQGTASGKRDPLRVLLVSSHWERKGGAQALAAVEHARQGGLKASLTVVGDHPLLPAWVRSLGRVSPDRMPAIYASHDVLVELATANAAGVTLTDAAHAGLPVIATRVGGVSTIVLDGVTGILVEPAPALAVEQAASALRRVADARERTRMAGEARKHALEALDWSLWARQVLAMPPTSS